MLTPAERQHFDRQLERVLQELPVSVRELLDEVPLVVDDYPSPEVMEEMGVEDPEELCGLYSGTPLTAPEQRGDLRMPDQILIYRAGILSEAADESGEVRDQELRRQIRITILHEVGHHHGLDEDDLEELGYE